MELSLINPSTHPQANCTKKKKKKNPQPIHNNGIISRQPILTPTEMKRKEKKKKKKKNRKTTMVTGSKMGFHPTIISPQPINCNKKKNIYSHI